MSKRLFARLGWSAYLAWHMRGQAGIPFLPMGVLRAMQARRVRSMVAHAYRTVPYYREAMGRLHLTVEDFHTAEDLAKLPLIDPEQVRAAPEQFVSTAWRRDDLFRLRTTGSTGAPRSIYHTLGAILQNASHGERDRQPVCSHVGKRFGYREAVIISHDCAAAKLYGIAQQHTLFPSRLRIHRKFLSLLDPPERNVRLIDEFRPDVIHSYGSYLTMLFSYLADAGEPFHRPKAVTYSSDSMSESARRLVQERFALPVFSTYQSNEALKLGFECERHTGLHLNIDLYPMRIVDGDGRDLPEGRTGETVISNLVNPGTVLLNYRLGDLAAVLPGRCSCGRSLPVLSFPPGRRDDLIPLPSGRVLHPRGIREVLAGEDQVWQYQVVQDSQMHFAVKIVAARSAARQPLRDRLAARFADLLGREVELDVSFVESIDRTAAGKYRPVISLCRPAAPAVTPGS